MDLHLSGKAAVVTGAGKGIGLAVTRALAAEGVRVLAACRTVTEDLAALGRTTDVLPLQADLTAADGPERAAGRGPARRPLRRGVSRPVRRGPAWPPRPGAPARPGSPSNRGSSGRSRG
ncbi:SDR family NAD(P)-dependent oxidoreductase [Kitasatospora sp. NBC_01246]|uniref:SDR family NAD(P)-dependent oxidoreductase n=1 Tax=Kitasatospora sp. NBC_01246 TaxID=2903570 RepID=UPI002E351365|nr:SDR family NAD(P)-dependent oxidoreductase [Kitasatospora sp. NBC_01246]